jgi:hypothetical protein
MDETTETVEPDVSTEQIWEADKTCLICISEGNPSPKVFKSASALTGHFRSHKRTPTKVWTKDAYIKKYGDKAKEQMVFKPKTPEQVAVATEYLLRGKEGIPAHPEREPEEQSFVDRMKSSLTNGERREFDNTVDLLFQQVDRDPLQRPRIATLALYQIYLNRLMEVQFKTKKYDENTEKAIKQADVQINKLMAELGLTRKQRLDSRADIKSTPASLISGYLDELERMNPEMLVQMRLEQDKILEESMARIRKFIISAAPESKSELGDEGIRVVPDIETVLKRANITI